MSDSKPSKIFEFDSEDPEMKRAHRRARETFRYFWREVAWERRRIIPGLGLAAVKGPFFDGTPEDPGYVEHMWINDVDVDGRRVRGTLLNQPNELTSVAMGDKVKVRLKLLSDWMYSIGGEVYGGHTVQLMRSRMGRRERQEHDDAWGLDFGDPEQVRLVPDDYPRRKDGEIGEHPMSVNMAEALVDQLRKDRKMIKSRDDRGWTLLHDEALAGSYPTVKVLLEHGADPAAETDDGWTAADLAHALGWERVERLLEK